MVYVTPSWDTGRWQVVLYRLNEDGSATQERWFVTDEGAAILRDELGVEPDTRVLIPARRRVDFGDLHADSLILRRT